MEISLEVLDRLNKLNRSETFGGTKVPYSTFYVPELSERVDVRVDYVRWVVERPRQTENVCYCCYIKTFSVIV